MSSTSLSRRLLKSSNSSSFNSGNEGGGGGGENGEETRSKKTMKLIFVCPETKDVSAQMQQAFEIFSSVENEDNIKWMNEKDTMEISDTDVNRTVFVFQEFVGDAFKKLEMKKARIVGPQCLISCDERNERLPKTKKPMLTATMSGLYVCCTNIDKVLRCEMHRKIELMAGVFCREYAKQVTHLVCGEVGSKKYLVAAKDNKPLMLPEWIEQCWQKGICSSVHASDKELEMFRCPIFKNFTITVSQVEGAQRKRLQKLIQENGGTYSGELRRGVTTHLVLDVPKGEKFASAKANHIYCLNCAWVYDSVEHGYCMDKNLYLVDAPIGKGCQGSSTPVKGEKGITMSDISTLSAINASTINETVVSDVSRSMINFKVSKDTTLDCFLRDLNVSLVSEAGPFLDGCKIFLSGFSPLTMEKLIKILNSGAATRFCQLTDAVSHVVVGSKIEDEHKKTLDEEQLIPYIVNFGWIVESYRLRRPADETEFQVADLTCTKLQVDTMFPEFSMANVNMSANVSKQNKNTENRSEMDDVMNQYMDEAETLPPEEEDDDEDLEPKIFKRKTFYAEGFDLYSLTNIKEMVETNGGKFFEVLSKSIVDYVIVPIPACEITAKAKQIVSNYWLQKCVFENTLFDVEMNPLFGSVDIDISKKPLKGCVLTFSSYTGVEKDCILQVSKLLGARCQESFSRKTDKVRGFRQNTHLIAPEPEGKKYEAAVKWGVPVVSVSWIVNCAIRNEKLSESEFTVSKSGSVSSDMGCSTPSVFQSTRIEKTASTSSCTSPVRIPKPPLFSTSHIPSSESMKKQPSTFSTETPTRGDSNIDWKNNDVFKTPVKDNIFKTPTCSQLASTAERVRKLQDGLKSKHNFPFLQNNRVKELIDKEGDESLNSSCDSSVAFDTPSKFTNPDVKFQPKLGAREAMAFLESPCSNKMMEESPTARLPLEDLYNLRIHQALHNEVKKTGSVVPHSTLVDSKYENELTLKRPLRGVVLNVSKKLSNVQRELNALGEKLGATCKWLYDKSCTHFVHMGKPKERCKDLRTAMNDKKFIVSPEWLRACEKNNIRVDEELYPYTYNPNMALDIVIKKSTPSLRSSQRNSAKVNDDESMLSNNGDSDANSSNVVMTVKKNNVMMIESANLKMEEIMAATKVAREKRVNRMVIQSNSSSNGSPSFTSFADNSGSRSHKSARKEVGPAENESEPWESMPITWEDPTSRLERTKLMAQLRTDTQPRDDEVEDEDDNSDNDETHLNDHGDSIALQHGPERSFDTSESLKEDCFQSYVFMFTKTEGEERANATKVIESCGGLVIDSQNFDSRCTHLLAKCPNRSEKFLASIAAGIWILHISFIDACKTKQRFVEEENYEFADKGLPIDLSVDGSRLAGSARYWRSNSRKADKPGAFFDWKVIVYSNESRTGSLVRLLEAGGATILSTTPPFTTVKGATHAFVDMAHLKKPNIDLSALTAANVRCLKPEYICTYLCDRSNVSLENYYIPDVLPLMKSSVNCDNSVVKRKSDEKDLVNKRSRQK